MFSPTRLRLASAGRHAPIGAIAKAAITLATLAPSRASAEPKPSVLRDPTAPLTFQADRLEGDATLGEVTLEGHVEVAYDRYRLRAPRLRLRIEDGAVVFAGAARAALCPCPDPPLTFVASGGRIERAGDLVLHWPRVAVGGVPVFGLPWLWLRSPEQLGVLPPIVAVRGSDGLLLGSGVHLPWSAPGGAVEAIDLTAGGYVLGGVELGAHLSTTGSDTRVTADVIHGTRVALEGRGALVPEGPRAYGAAWAIDAIRGDRAQSGTVDLDAATRPFDTGSAEVTVRAETGTVSSVAAGGVVARALRGEGVVAAGPRALLALGGPLRGAGSWSADAAGVVLGDETHAVSLGRASAGAELDVRPGPFELRASANARGRFARDGSLQGPSTEAASATRADLELPFARTFASASGDAPLVHWITPGLSVRGALAAQRGPFFAPIGGAVPPASWLTAAGVSTAVGRTGGPTMRLDVRAGATGGTDAAEGLLHARLGAEGRLVAASVESAAVGEPPSASTIGAPATSSVATRGAALLARVRVGALSGPWLRVDAAGQAGGSAGRARAVAWGAWAVLPGDDLAYFAAPGWTGGAEASIPLGFGLRASARVDADLEARALLAVRTGAEYRHPCGCFGLGIVAADRLGREGVDVAFSVDVTPPVPASHPVRPGP